MERKSENELVVLNILLRTGVHGFREACQAVTDPAIINDTIIDYYNRRCCATHGNIQVEFFFFSSSDPFVKLTLLDPLDLLALIFVFKAEFLLRNFLELVLPCSFELVELHFVVLKFQGCLDPAQFGLSLQRFGLLLL